MSRETFTIETVETRPSARGPFKRAKLSGIGYVSVFNDGDKDFLEENLGQTASAEIKVDNEEKGWKSASAFTKASGNDSAPLGGERMSKEDWDAKETRKSASILLLGHIDRMIQWQLANSSAPDSMSWETYDDLRASARKKVVKDMDWIKNYAGSDPPFEQEHS